MGNTTSAHGVATETTEYVTRTGSLLRRYISAWGIVPLQ